MLEAQSASAAPPGDADAAERRTYLRVKTGFAAVSLIRSKPTSPLALVDPPDGLKDLDTQGEWTTSDLVARLIGFGSHLRAKNSFATPCFPSIFAPHRIGRVTVYCAA
jgi:predicted RNase H-like nuclease